MTTLYDFTVNDPQGGSVSLDAYRAQVVLIVNTATRCGLTPQYSALQELYDAYKDRGFTILDFPCNQFRQQASGTDAEIGAFCERRYGTTFPRFQKIDVNGSTAAPLYQWLKAAQGEDAGGAAFKEFLLKLASLGEAREGTDIKWNFTKFLINREGECVGRYAPSTPPAELDSAIQGLL